MRDAESDHNIVGRCPTDTLIRRVATVSRSFNSFVVTEARLEERRVVAPVFAGSNPVGHTNTMPFGSKTFQVMYQSLKLANSGQYRVDPPLIMPDWRNLVDAVASKAAAPLRA